MQLNSAMQRLKYLWSACACSGKRTAIAIAAVLTFMPVANNYVPLQAAVTVCSSVSHSRNMSYCLQS